MRRVILTPDEEAGGYTVTVPSLPGCISQGETYEEAVVNIQEAIRAYIKSLEMDGMPIPPEDGPEAKEGSRSMRHVIVTDDTESGGYYVEVPSLPGCFS